MPYPTPEEILKEPRPVFKRGAIQILKTHKKVVRALKMFPSDEGILVIDDVSLQRTLLKTLAALYEKPLGGIIEGNRYCYSPATRIIMLGRDNLSLISALHEFGHHLFGDSELKACRWSVWLFKESYPKAFEKLSFKGHLLVKTDKTT